MFIFLFLSDLCTVNLKIKIMLSTIIFIVVLLHLVAGFGYLAYKLSPSKKTTDSDNTTLNS
jgi:ABC-type multidrug transport system permease subunit